MSPNCCRSSVSSNSSISSRLRTTVSLSSFWTIPPPLPPADHSTSFGSSPVVRLCNHQRRSTFFTTTQCPFLLRGRLLFCFLLPEGKRAETRDKWDVLYAYCKIGRVSKILLNAASRPKFRQQFQSEKKLHLSLIIREKWLAISNTILRILTIIFLTVGRTLISRSRPRKTRWLIDFKLLDLCFFCFYLIFCIEPHCARI